MSVQEMPIRILLVEDDELLREGLVEYLQISGLVVDGVGTGQQFQRKLKTNGYQVVVVDLGLPDVTGMSLVQYTRQVSDAAVIVLTANNTASNRIGAYESGGDLFLAKPVEGEVLVAAINSLYRRFEERVYKAGRGEGAWVFEQASRKLSAPNGLTTTLTTKEGELLQILVRAKGRVVPRSHLQLALYGREDESSLASLNTLLARLRQKISQAWPGDSPVVTAHGVGYRSVI